MPGTAARAQRGARPALAADDGQHVHLGYQPLAHRRQAGVSGFPLKPGQSLTSMGYAQPGGGTSSVREVPPSG